MIIDSGILIAAAARTDKHHAQAVAVLRERARKTVPEPVVVETAWYLGSRYGPTVEAGFLRSMTRPAFRIESPTAQDRARAADLLEAYADAQLGYVDASVMAIAERLNDPTIATFDRRDFSIVRPSHVEAFTLIP